MSEIAYLFSRMLIQSSLTVILVHLLVWLGLSVAAGDVVIVSALVVSALFVARLAATMIVITFRIRERYVRGLLGYVVVVLGATLMLIYTAPRYFSPGNWWMLALLIAFTDLFAWALLWAAGAGRHVASEVQ